MSKPFPTEAAAKLTAALETVAHTVTNNRDALEYFHVPVVPMFDTPQDASERQSMADGLTEILDALDAWSKASNAFLAALSDKAAT